jgi:DNA-binding transcriptional ArsR family regulator
MPTVTLSKKAEAKPMKAKTTKPKVDPVQRLKQMQRAAILLKQASDPTRVQVITMLADGERHVGALGESLAMSQPAVSHHLALLRHGGIIEPRRAGKRNFYALTDKGEHLARILRGLVD